MKVIAQILSATLLAGLAAAQGAPASQTVQPQSTQKAQPSATNGKNLSKSATVPKTNTQPTAAPSQTKTTAKSTAAPAKPKTTTTVAAKAQPAKPKVQPKTQAKASPKPASPKAVSSKPKSASLAEKATAALKKAPTAAPTPTPAKPTETQATAQNTPAKLPNPGRRDPFLSPIALAAARSPAAACSTGKHCLVVGQIALKGIIQTKEGNIAMVENGARRSYYLHENDALFDGSVVKISGDSVTFRQESNDYLGRPVSKEVIKKVSAPAV